jgi:hypothetical protein
VLKKENLVFIAFFFLSILLAYLVPKALIILATPFVYEPQTFNETYVEVSVFDLLEKVVIRANVTDPDDDVDECWLNLTASNGTLIYENVIMENTTIRADTTGWVFEINYTLQGGDPPGTWIINVTANDTLSNTASNSTTFTVNRYISIILSQALTQGVMFGEIIANTVGNPALNNSADPYGGTQYNITLSSVSNENADFYSRLNESFETGIYVNESSSITNSTHGFSTNTTIANGLNWYVLGNSTLNCTNIAPGNNCWTKFYMDAGINIPEGIKERTYEMCAVYTTGSPSLCG